MSCKPKCIHDRYSPYLDAWGNMMPCCWIDKKDYEDFIDYGIISEKFNISNINAIEEIFYSDEWQTFINDLYNNPENLPKVCQKICNVKFQTTQGIYIKQL